MVLKYLEEFEKVIVGVLTLLLMAVVILAVLDLAWVLIKDIATPPVLLLEVSELLEIFGVFLLVLIGIELLETLKAYIHERVVHVEVVLTVAIIAIARKVIVLDAKALTGLALLGIAAIILALAAAYYLLKRGRQIARETGSARSVAE